MRGNKFRTLAFLFGALLFVSLPAAAQQEMVFVNGKIVTVDNTEFNSTLGTIAQAMHVKDGKILHIGTNDQIRPMAGTGVKVVDLKGRTVLPGFILTHEHPWDWSPVSPPIIKNVLTDDIVITRTLEGSPEENVKAFPGVLQEALSKAKPGQWIYVVFTFGRNYEWSDGGNGGYGKAGFDPRTFDALDGKRITKEQLDAAAPNNPVLLRDVFVSTVMNQKALDAGLAAFPNICTSSLVQGDNSKCTNSPARSPMRWMAQDVMLKDRNDKLTELMVKGMEWWAGYGMTGYASNAYSPSNLRVYKQLDKEGRMPIRNMWTWNWHPEMFEDPFLMTLVASMTNEGSPYLWYGGATVAVGAGCTQAKPLTTSKLATDDGLNIQRMITSCAYAPGSIREKFLYDYVKTGGRFVNLHTVGDGDIDNIMNTIIKASKDAGLTDEQIRSRRHGFDHTTMWPRPDQIPTLNKYNFVASGDGYEVYQASPAVFEIFGEGVASWVVPKKRLVEGKVYNSIEVDRALPSTDLSIFSGGISPIITRKAWDGKVYASGQAVDRETALKISTAWGAYYVLREKELGSLKPGYWADFIVLDKDYLTVPVDDIEKLKVLMTVVGGKVVHLVPSVARENGMQPTGAMVTIGPAANW